MLRTMFLLLSALPGLGQASQFALRFYGTGVGPPGQQDRVLIPLDDNQVGPDQSAACDIGAGSFSIDFWMKGDLADNGSASLGGDVEIWDYTWIEGNIILDRDVWCGTARAFGVSITGGYVAFGTDTGDGPTDASNTIEGDTPVLDGNWHHVCLVRDVSAGVKRIFVDGELDMSSSLGFSFADLSYPNDGVPVTGDCGTGQLTPYGWYLVVAAEKHDAGAAYPSFNGYVDELRVWDKALTQSEIQSYGGLVLATPFDGLVGQYRFEEGSGTALQDTSGLINYTGQLIAGSSGNGEWVAYAQDPNNTAPVGNWLGDWFSIWPQISVTDLVLQVNGL